MTLDLWADDDAQEQQRLQRADAESRRRRSTLTLSKYRGPGDVTFGEPRPKFEALKGGKPDEPYSGKASTTVNVQRAWRLHAARDRERLLRQRRRRLRLLLDDGHRQGRRRSGGAPRPAASSLTDLSPERHPAGAPAPAGSHPHGHEFAKRTLRMTRISAKQPTVHLRPLACAIIASAPRTRPRLAAPARTCSRAPCST